MTTIAMEIGREIGIPVTHLDRLAWGPGWQPVDPPALAARELAVAHGDAWVIDGGYPRSPSWPSRLEGAQMVILVESPLALCLWRIVRRGLRGDRRVRRPDLPDGCDERVSIAFLFWTLAWSLRTRTVRRALGERLTRVRGR